MLKPDWTGLSLQQLVLKPDWTGLSLQQLMLKLDCTGLSLQQLVTPTVANLIQSGQALTSTWC